MTSLLSRTQQKIAALITCYLCDVTLLAWIYFKVTNFNRYNRLSKDMLDSPDFQFQLYRVLLQSLTFALLLFFIAQTMVYILAWRNFRSAYLYLKFFAVFGFAIALYIVFNSSFFALLPVVLYVCGYYVFARNFKEMTVLLQSSTLSPTPPTKIL